nr:hypothetical protein [uncultured Desulfobacter sp.]
MKNFKLSDDLPMVILNEFLHWLKLFLSVGGMPEAVRIYRDTRSLLEVDAVKQSILQTYRDDLYRYQDADDADLVNSGPVCEQMIGQHLLYRTPSFQKQLIPGFREPCRVSPSPGDQPVV